jgi:SAM-dependent methyltransferase
VPNRLKAGLKSVLPDNVVPAIRRIVYFGILFRCPVCRATVRKLLPGGQDIPVLRELEVVGGGRIEQDVCPVCFSSSRTRLVHRYLVDYGELRGEGELRRVLHFAPERGIANWLLRLQSVHYIAADLSPDLYQHALSRKMDVTRIEFPDSQFDLVICNHVLEHVPNDRLAMREIFRVLKHGGRAILQAPISQKLTTTLEDPSISKPRDREKVFGQWDHVRIYGLDYPERLRHAGFSVDIIDPVQRWGIDTVVRLRLNSSEKLFIGRKLEHN